MPHRRRTFADLLICSRVFVLLGPPIGGAALFLGMTIASDDSLIQKLDGFMWIFMFAIFGYVAGAIPALLTGAAAWAFLWLRDYRAWVAVNAVMGALISGSLNILFSIQDIVVAGELVQGALGMAAVGAVATLLPSFALLKLWRQNRSDAPASI